MALADQADARNRFRTWAAKRVPGARSMNVGSGAQIRQLLFAGVPNAKGKGDAMEKIRYFKVGHPSCGWALGTTR